MLRLMLDTHSQIAIPFETDFIGKYYVEREAFGDLRDDSNVQKLLQAIQAGQFVKRGELAGVKTEDLLLRLKVRTYAGVVDALFRTWASERGKSHWGDKTPGVPDMHILEALFPDALFLHLIRDGRDVAASRMTTWRQRSVLHAAHDWCWKVSFARRLAVTMADRYREVRFEDLVKSPESELQEICSWMGVPYEPGMLEYHLTAADRMPEDSVKRHHQTSVRPPDPEKIGAWKKVMTRGERAMFQEVAATLLGNLGYELENDRGLGVRLAKRATAVAHGVRGLSLFESPCLR